MKKELYIPIVGIIDAEILLFYRQIFLGLLIHTSILIAIILIISLGIGKLSLKEKNILQSLTLLIILRMINLSMPHFFNNPLIQYSMIYGIMFIPIYLIIKNQHLTLKELGMNFKRIYIYIPLSFLIGSLLAIIEYYILTPSSLIEQINLTDITIISVVMFIFIGTIEEIIFRGILQTKLGDIFGRNFGILLSGSIFGIMHASYGILEEIVFVSIFGIMLGYIFQKTKSLPFVISIHGVTNVLLFGILPNIVMLPDSSILYNILHNTFNILVKNLGLSI